MTEKLKDIIEPMVAQALIHRPKNLRLFMLEWLKKTYNRPGSAAKSEYKEEAVDEEKKVVFA